MAYQFPCPWCTKPIKLAKIEGKPTVLATKGDQPSDPKPPDPKPPDDETSIINDIIGGDE